MTPLQAATDLRRRLALLKRSVMQAEEDTAADGLAVARALSSGALTRSDLARRGHPYARRHGKPQLDPALINVQTGRFRRAWKTRRISGTRIEIQNNAPEGVFLQHGTRRMFERPIRERVWSLIQARRMQRIRAALVAALRGRP